MVVQHRRDLAGGASFGAWQTKFVVPFEEGRDLRAANKMTEQSAKGVCILDLKTMSALSMTGKEDLQQGRCCK